MGVEFMGINFVFLNKVWSIEERLGVGFDIEFIFYKPVFIKKENFLDVAYVDGIMILLPFVSICISKGSYEQVN